MDIDAVADELYGLAPEQFTATRNERAKQAKQEGDRDLAASIQTLAKPNSVAALANQLVRRHRDELAPLLELGEGLRAATAALSGPELRTLGQQRHRLIAVLVGMARVTAEQDGRAVSGDAVRGLEETLHAALADQDAAAELMAGRLTDALHRSGLGGPADGSTRPPGPARAGPTVAPRRPTRGRGGFANGKDTLAQKRAEREQAQRDEAEARRKQAEDDLTQAGAELAQAEADAIEGKTAVDRAGDTVTRLREELDRATSELQRLQHAQQRLRTEVDRAQRAVRIAQRQVDQLD